jgi:hypothetical protein
MPLGPIDGIPVGAHRSVGLIVVVIAELLAESVLPAAYPRERPAVYWTVAIAAAVRFWPRYCLRTRACAGGAPRRGRGRVDHLVDARRSDRV